MILIKTRLISRMIQSRFEKIFKKNPLFAISMRFVIQRAQHRRKGCVLATLALKFIKRLKMLEILLKILFTARTLYFPFAVEQSKNHFELCVR